MSTLLAEQLRGIIEGPLGTEEVTPDTVTERVGMVEQNERRHVFGVMVFRDGEDQYFINDSSKPVQRRDVIESVKSYLESRGRLLDEKLNQTALQAFRDHQQAIDDGEQKIGEIFKKIAKRYVENLKRWTGANWKVVAASESILSFDSDESPKRAVDIYWEYDPIMQNASVFIEGPKGKQKIYTRQKMSDIPRKNYIDWLSGVLKEDMDKIFALMFEDGSEKTNTEGPQSLAEELWGIIDEDAVVMPRRSVAKSRPLPGKPKVVASGTKVGNLFKQLVLALTRGEDWDAVIKALRKERVPENHISYAIKNKKVPYIYAEEIEEDDEVEVETEPYLSFSC
jgi:hypothetical protein